MKFIENIEPKNGKNSSVFIELFSCDQFSDFTDNLSIEDNDGGENQQ